MTVTKPVIHMGPPKESWILPCCNKILFSMPNHDQVTYQPEKVTCKGAKHD